MRNFVFAITFLIAGCGASLFGLVSLDSHRDYLAEHRPDWLAAVNAPCQRVGYIQRDGNSGFAFYRSQPGERIDEYRCAPNVSIEKIYGDAFLEGRIIVGMSKTNVDALWGSGLFERGNRGATAYSYDGFQRGNPWGRHIVVFYDDDDEVADWLTTR